MSSTMEKLSSNKVRLDFTVDAETFEKGMQAAYRKNVKKIRVPGFRPGKAPRKVIEGMYGESVFYDDAFDAIFPEIYAEAIKEHELNPVDRPELDLKQIGTGYLPLCACKAGTIVSLRLVLPSGTGKGVERRIIR